MSNWRYKAQWTEVKDLTLLPRYRACASHVSWRGDLLWDI